MSLFDELKKLTRPYSGAEYDEFMDDPDATPETRIPQSEPPRRSAAPIDRPNAYADFEQPRFDRGYDQQPRYEERRAPTPIKSSRDKVVNLNSPSQVQMVLVKPEFFDAAAEIADHLRGGRPVLMNLEKAPKDTSRRLIDFLSGVAYALDGKIRRVANNTYILTPYNVDVMGDPMEEASSTSSNPFM